MWSEWDHLLTGSCVASNIFFPKWTIRSRRKMSFFNLLQLATAMFSAVRITEITGHTNFIIPQCGTDGQFYEARTAFSMIAQQTSDAQSSVQDIQNAIHSISMQVRSTYKWHHCAEQNNKTTRLDHPSLTYE